MVRKLKSYTKKEYREATKGLGHFNGVVEGEYIVNYNMGLLHNELPKDILEAINEGIKNEDNLKCRGIEYLKGSYGMDDVEEFMKMPNPTHIMIESKDEEKQYLHREFLPGEDYKKILYFIQEIGIDIKLSNVAKDEGEE